VVKNIIKIFVNKSIILLAKSKIGLYVFQQIVETSINNKMHISYKGINFCFSVPNALNRYRIETFATKEPETLDWISSIDDKSILWDIGANVGLYSCFAAKYKDCKVFSFEPSVFNIELLARNIFNNKLTDKVSIIPLPLTDAIEISSLNMTSTNWGGALSTFGKTYGQDGKPLDKIFEFKVIGLSISAAIESLNIPKPDYIKMDVDGIEHLILKGGLEALKNVKSVLIEIDESFDKQFSDSSRYLQEAGLVFKEKFSADKSGDPLFANCYNQIWVRKI
jgi:FkbM family methyltransferase